MRAGALIRGRPVPGCVVELLPGSRVRKRSPVLATPGLGPSPARHLAALQVLASTVLAATEAAWSRSAAFGGGGMPKAPPLTVEDDGTVLAAGTVRLDELGQCFDLDLSHEDVDSVSGLVLALLGRPPVPGDEVTYDRVRLTVTAVRGHGVQQARARLLPPAIPPEA